MCDGEHEAVCVHCQSIENMFQCLNGCLQDLDQLPEEKRKEFHFIIKTAYENVSNYKDHIIRTFMQSYEWNNKLENDTGPEVAYVTSDWGMKL